MNNVVENEIMKELTLVERIIVKMFEKTFIKVYNIGRIKTFNNLIL